MSQSFNPTKDIPNMKGKVVLVTGANVGIGKATIRAIAPHDPARIYLCSRRRASAESAVSDLRAETRYNRIEILDLDLSSLDSVKKCAAEFNARESRLDLLFLNAGVANIAPALTKEGYEAQFGINHMGHALFVQLLMPKLLQTTREPNADVRIIATASNGAFSPLVPKGGLALDSMRKADALGSMTLYAHSKVAVVLFMRKLAQLYPNITSVSAHPGVVKTDIWDKGGGGLFSIMYRPVVWMTSVTADEGAKSQLWCGTRPLGGAKGVLNGQYYEPVGKQKKYKGAVGDDKLMDELWDWTNKELAKHGGPGWPSS